MAAEQGARDGVAIGNLTTGPGVWVYAMQVALLPLCLQASPCSLVAAVLSVTVYHLSLSLSLSLSLALSTALHTLSPSLQGRRDYMEDDFEFRVEPEAGLSLYGLYDGHGGAAVSAHCAQHLLAHVQAFLARNPTGAADAPGGRLGRAALGKALSYAFGKTDREVIPHSTTLPPAHPLSVSLSFKTRHTACPISTG